MVYPNFCGNIFVFFKVKLCFIVYVCCEIWDLKTRFKHTFP